MNEQLTGHGCIADSSSLNPMLDNMQCISSLAPRNARTRRIQDTTYLYRNIETIDLRADADLLLERNHAPKRHMILCIEDDPLRNSAALPPGKERKRHGEESNEMSARTPSNQALPGSLLAAVVNLLSVESARLGSGTAESALLCSVTSRLQWAAQEHIRGTRNEDFVHVMKQLECMPYQEKLVSSWAMDIVEEIVEWCSGPQETCEFLKVIQELERCLNEGTRIWKSAGMPACEG